MRTCPKNILVALDFSENARNALIQAYRIALSRQANLHVVHVVESTMIGGLARVLRIKPEEMDLEAAQEAHQRIEALYREVGIEPDKVNTIVRMGNPYDEIMAAASDTETDMLVLGSRSANDSQRRVSKLASNCVRRAPLEVMLVRRAHVTPFTSICAFVDFSEVSQAVVDRAAFIARTEKARLMLAHVYLPPWKVMHYMSSTELPSEAEQQAYRDEIIGNLEGLIASLSEGSQGIEVGYELIESSERVVGVDDYIEQSHFDLVVIKTRGRTGLRRVLLNTIAEHIVRTSPCSVLTLKPADFS